MCRPCWKQHSAVWRWRGADDERTRTAAHRPVLVVEGKYDAARLSHLTDAMILLTDGFGIYKDKKRQQLLKAWRKKTA